MKKNTSKRALILSFLSLLLCFSMLIGTTFAWFTDEVKSANNIITSGNLDIELDYWNYKTKTWTDVQNSSEILDEETLWEPGYTEVVYFRITNAGSLALKYQFGIRINEEKAGVNVDGDDFLLSDYIQFGVKEIEVTDPDNFAGAFGDDRAAAIKYVSEVSDKISTGYTKSSELKATDAPVYLAMVVYMPTDVGNVANYKKSDEADKPAKYAPEIKLGVNIFATQMENEIDSFGPDYDSAAPWTGMIDINWYDPAATEFVLDSAEELAGLAAIVNGTATAPVATYAATEPETIKDSFAGKTIKLAKDLNLRNIPWTPIGNAANGFNGTFDGDGHTIYNLTVSGTTAVGLFGYALNGGNIKNLNIVNATDTANDYAGALLGRGYTDVVNCRVENAKVTVTPYLTADGVYDGGAKAGAVVGQLLEGAGNTVVDCTAKDVVITGYRDLGGVLGMAHDNNTVSGCSAQNVTINYVAVAGVYDNGTTPNQNAGAIVGRIQSSATVDFTAEENANFKLVRYVVSYDSLKAALTAGGDVVVMDNFTIGADDTITVPAGVEVILDLNGKTISAISDDADKNDDGAITSADNEVVIDVRGTLTVKNGTITYKHTGDNFGWNACADVFYVGFNATLNVENATIINEGGTDMAFAIDMVNADANGNGITVNVTDSTIKSSYIPVRVFNNGAGMNNVTIKNSTLAGVSRAFWVHVYSNADNGGKGIKSATLNLDIFNTAGEDTNGNKFIASTPARIIEFGFTDEINFNEYGVQIVTVADQTALNDAMASGDVVVNLPAGDYKMPSSNSNGDITISGTKESILDMIAGAYLDSANVIIEGVTIKTGTGMANGNGSDYAALYSTNVTYINCTFVGPMRIGRDGAKFINCTFTELGNDYVWTYGNDVTFEKCTFNSNGKAILVYSDGGKEVSQVTVKNCVFNATNGAKAGAIANQNCAAIEIQNFGNGVNLVTEGNTYSDNFSGEWRIKAYHSGNPKVIVNGTEYTSIALDGKTMTIDASNNVTVIG